jgi:hypothetical protein
MHDIIAVNTNALKTRQQGFAEFFGVHRMFSYKRFTSLRDQMPFNHHWLRE